MLLATAQAHAVYVRNDVPVASYNALAPQARYGATVYLANNTVAGGGLASQACSGVLVSPTSILTAAHCARLATTSYSIGFGANIPTVLPAGDVGSIVVNPAYTIRPLC